MSGLYTLNLNSEVGCDSIVELYLMVMSDTLFTEERTLCSNELPYVWNGQTLTSAGVYNTGVASSLGCDSIVQITLSVLEVSNTNDYVEIAFEELPYTYNDTVFGVDTKLGVSSYDFHYTASNGCDSVHSLTLKVEEPVGLVQVRETEFSIYPNPVKLHGEVMVDGNFTETEMEGMVVEVYNSLGQGVKTIRPNTMPVRIDGFDASGVFSVRITTADNRVVYGKVVVR